MSEILVGRLYSWPEFAEDGQDVWLLHLGDPPFFLRVIHRPETGLPEGDVTDLAFPLTSDPRFALGNLMFVEPRPVDMREAARIVAGAIDAVNDEGVALRLAFDTRPFDPVPALIVPEDLPRGFIVGVIYDSRTGATEKSWWIAHIGLPPFVMRVSDAADEDVEEGDIWAGVGGTAVLSHPQWLTAVGCDDEELRHLAATAAQMIADIASEDMGVLSST
jgi:hypothetical protein